MPPIETVVPVSRSAERLRADTDRVVRLVARERCRPCCSQSSTRASNCGLTCALMLPRKLFSRRVFGRICHGWMVMPSES